MKFTKEKVLIGCGIWLVILPATGFPHSWKSVLTALTGLAVVYLGALIWREQRIHTVSKTNERTEAFTQTS